MVPAATLATLSADLMNGHTTSRALVEACLAEIDRPEGEGARAFLDVDREAALAQAGAMDALRASGAAPSPFAGIPISVKDLFDIGGQTTKAGAKALADAPPASKDAQAVARLRRAGFVVLGRTNMSEFAFSGLGLNPHFGTPLNPWDRATGRLPGGSSSGGAVSVADRMAHATLGTDTGGSCRIPAAFTGIVGFKPTARRVPAEGVIPLSTSLDSIGPLARTVACCATLDAFLADEPAPDLTGASVAGLRLAVPRTVVFNDIDETVVRDFDRTLSRLTLAGATISEIDVPEFADIPTINAKGGFTAAESFAWHRSLMATHGHLYDARIRARIERGQHQTAADYIDLLAARRAFISAVEKRIAAFDSLIFPTVPIVAPKLSEVAADEDFTNKNLLVLRNSTIINFLDGCAISVPMHEPGKAPTGLTLAARGGLDRVLLRHASAVEKVLARRC